MKFPLFIIVIIFISHSCGTPKTGAAGDDIDPVSNAVTVTVKENTTYTLKTDGTGASYPAYVLGDATTLIFTYEEKAPEGIADGDYKETLHITFTNNSDTLTLKDGDLKNVEMVFGKFCFCKGEAGYRAVSKGTLEVSKDGDVIHIAATIDIPEVNHKMQQLNKRFSL